VKVSFVSIFLVIATLSLLQPYGAVRFMLRHENYGGKCTTLALILLT